MSEVPVGIWIRIAFWFKGAIQWIVSFFKMPGRLEKLELAASSESESASGGAWVCDGCGRQGSFLRQERRAGELSGLGHQHRNPDKMILYFKCGRCGYEWEHHKRLDR